MDNKAKIPLMRNANAYNEYECDKRFFFFKKKKKNYYRSASICANVNTTYNDDKMNPFMDRLV